MGLYDRNYVNKDNSFETSGFEQQSEAKIVAFVKETYKLFAASLLSGTAGAYVGVGMAATIASIKWPLFFLEIALLIGLYFVKNKPGINLAVLFGFTFVSGLTIGPLLSTFLGMAGGTTIVANAFLMTTVIFGALSFYAVNTTKDFTVFGKPLMITLIVVVVGSLLNAFVFQSPMFHILITAVTVVLFSFFILYDTQNIIRGLYETPIEGAVALYLDFFNLFVSLLQIFGLFGGNDD